MTKLQELNSKFEQIISDSYYRQSPSVLYHYTSWESAKSILSTKKFRFSAYDCTNDPAELESANEIIRTVANNVRQAFKDPIDMFIKHFEILKASKVIKIYLGCFSDQKNTDSQWMKYADQGKGLCLGINVLQEAPPEHDGVNCGLVRVEYSEEPLRKQVDVGFRTICQALSQSRLKNDEQAQKDALNAISRIAGFAAIGAKKPQWSAEKERRQVAIVRKGFLDKIVSMEKVSRGNRYIELPLRAGDKLISLNEIIIGHNNQDIESAKSRVQKILSDCGYSNGDAEFPKITVAPPIAQTDLVIASVAR